MKELNLFKSSSMMTKKAIVIAKAETKKAINSALQSYEASIDAEFTKVIKATDKKARDAANAAKGRYGTALEVVANCYTYQTAGGDLCYKKTLEEADGEKRKVWAAKKLTRSAACGIVREALKNFTNNIGEPVVIEVTIGANVE